MSKDKGLIELRCNFGQLLAKVDMTAVRGIVEIKCKRCGKVHIFRNGVREDVNSDRHKI